ncbi:hypothetical protein RJT34_19466 [Clitoria ternatea]|uniref:CTCHY-type domain-containing protein n=1 Tax=Clitoria ternatea TaxID=43366 RepID=A0AAN9IR91_CLITE
MALMRIIMYWQNRVAEVCSNCGVSMAEYCCDVCKFYDDDVTVGGHDKFFLCMKCGSFHAVSLQNNHSCVENSLKNFCPVCFEDL